MKTERDQIVAKARKMCADPATEKAWRAAWNRVLDVLEPIYLAQRPRMKSFEVHHANEKAREAFLRAAVAGTSLDECERLAIVAVAS